MDLLTGFSSAGDVSLTLVCGPVLTSGGGGGSLSLERAVLRAQAGVGRGGGLPPSSWGDKAPRGRDALSSRGGCPLTCWGGASLAGGSPIAPSGTRGSRHQITHKRAHAHATTTTPESRCRHGTEWAFGREPAAPTEGRRARRESSPPARQSLAAAQRLVAGGRRPSSALPLDHTSRLRDQSGPCHWLRPSHSPTGDALHAGVAKMTTRDRCGVFM